MSEQQPPQSPLEQLPSLGLPPAYATPPASPRHRLTWWVLLSLLGNAVMLVAIIAGFVHIVTGGGRGCNVIRKDGWALEDTFVDLDDYVGKPVISLLPKAKVVRALHRAELIELPRGFGGDDDEDDVDANEAISTMDGLADRLCACPTCAAPRGC